MLSKTTKSCGNLPIMYLVPVYIYISLYIYIDIYINYQHKPCGNIPSMNLSDSLVAVKFETLFCGSKFCRPLEKLSEHSL